MSEVKAEISQGVPQTEPYPGITGDLRLHEFTSKIFRNTRMLRVWLPPRYEAPENRQRQYPVFYLNDGQNLFDNATSYTGVKWAVDEAADRLIRQEVIPPLIIIGIDNAQSERMKEYLPYRSLNPPVLRPQGKRYPDFLMKEVMPFVQRLYRVAPGRENTALGGSSLGALISLYAAIDQPELCSRLLLESPSLFVSKRKLLKHSLYFLHWPDRIFLAIGTKETGREDKDQQAVQDVRELEGILRRARMDERRLRVNIDEGAVHHEREWAKRFPDALQFLFGT
ncbi:MAG TPA: alpha/beta hydrolase-fold protein [Terriglobales bacterium]|nr:alpha/beta hydrolase-fold protein [Terriglobales bacterium]